MYLTVLYCGLLLAHKGVCKIILMDLIPFTSLTWHYIPISLSFSTSLNPAKNLHYVGVIRTVDNDSTSNHMYLLSGCLMVTRLLSETVTLGADVLFAASFVRRKVRRFS